MDYEAFKKNNADIHSGLGYLDSDLKIDMRNCAGSSTTNLSPIKKSWNKTVININESEDVKLGNIVLENGFTGIMNKSFYKNLSVTGFDASKCTSLKNIGGDVFKGDMNLANVTLNEGLELIDSNSFADCISLGYIFIPKSVKKIDKTAFSNSGLRVIACYDDQYEMVKELKDVNCISKIISFDENYLINNIDSLQAKMNDRYDLLATESIAKVLNYLVEKNFENAKNEKVVALVNNIGCRKAGELLNSIRTKGLSEKRVIRQNNPVF